MSWGLYSILFFLDYGAYMVLWFVIMLRYGLYDRCSTYWQDNHGCFHKHFFSFSHYSKMDKARLYRVSDGGLFTVDHGARMDF